MNAGRQSGGESPSPDLSAFLNETLANADALLEVAKRDPKVIAQPSKMNEADEVLGTNPRLEELRWFVYPKEVASILLEGKLDGLEHEPLVGALDPFGVQANVDSRDKKRKSETDVGGVESQDNGGSESIMVFFRDGEHSGEATLADIAAGIDDGELSDRCEVFDGSSGEWLSYESFQRGSKKLKAETASVLTLDLRRTLKKPLRDHSSWGEGAIVPAIDPSTKDAAPPAHMLVDDDEGIEAEKTETLDEAVKKGPEEVAHDHSVDRRKDDEHAVSTTETKDVVIPAEQSLLASPVPVIQTSKRKKIKHIKPPAKMMRLINQASTQWEMIEDGDRLLLGLSGGKDSLSLLHALLELQRKLPTKFEIEVCTIDPMTPSFDPSPLIPYVESLGLKYHYIRDDIVSRASKSGKDGEIVSSLCAYCARMKRGNLYGCARRNNCNKLVLAQHLDDCAETFMMTVMHNGFLRTMKAHYKINAGDISVIRPMVYCRESLMTDFAKAANLPVINENCPACFEEPKERARVKKLLSREETLFPHFYDNIRRSLIPLMHDDSTAILRAYLEETVAKGRKENYIKKVRKSKDDRAITEGDGGGDEPPAALVDDTDKKTVSLQEASDEELMKELARRKADKYRLAGAMKRGQGFANDDPLGIPDPTGQVCTLNGGDGSISCRDLME